MLGQGGYGMMDKVNKIRMPGRPGSVTVLTYYQVCDIIYGRKEELVCLRR